MKTRTHGENIAHRFLTSLLALGACFVMAQPAFPGDGHGASSGQTPTDPGSSGSRQPANNSAALPAGGAGMVIYIDPQTGAILKEPAPGTVPLQLTPELENAFSTSDQGLVEVPSALPGGGVKVDLQGRFQSPLFVTIDGNGNAKFQHLHEMPQSGDKK